MKKLICSTLVATMLLSTNVFADDFIEAVPISQPIIATSDTSTSTQQNLTLTDTTTLNVTPDIAKINVYVSNTGSTPSEAKALTDADVKALSETLVNNNICSESDIMSNNFSIYQNYSYDNSTGTPTPSGYIADASFIITLNDADNDKLDNALDTIASSQHTTISYIDYASSKYDDYYNQALVQSIKSTSDRAKYISNAIFNDKDVNILEVSENGAYNTAYYEKSNMLNAESDSNNYMPSSIGISATATVTFGLN